ncbi:EamA family transporter [Roseobacter sp. HKCCD9010]|nr:MULTISPECIES: DMT family transporter [unclassified Roseobacter]MBF9051239.1 EamA family transporter [Rhodobacterales bacterium HKCCD4356]NNV13286.1 EamA family transporter [Roseobacter sp. HKCCD7357]NNV17537.1 EamA family transporter [Roseobacter sp. HKCCD8768]NNV27143.1 EamA family transporter [Roseobacter sp. HKCCD8192]NNV31263.1 EamA family transporter [Roseobacter sp. HKCCD9061]
MRLILLTCLTMVAFAANSILNRMAVGAGHIGALEFSLIRVIAGAVMLAALVVLSRKSLPIFQARRLWGAFVLSLYLLGFSVAYLQLDAGLGALILFGVVQVTMFGGALVAGDAVPRRRWIGAGLALAGLIWLMWPGEAFAVPLIASGMMVLAGVGWGLYSLAGRGAKEPLADTAANFILAVPMFWLPMLFLPVQLDAVATTQIGVILAVICGAVTSGLGYALWYTVLPRLGASAGGLVQLTVPVIAILGGVALLGEAVSWRLVGASALVLGGIAYGLVQRKIGSNGS